ncbi:hypothetical protein [Oleiharenicola sp. Vm1]|uniref:hypothetical protein n=1 Tax=Oleiharenicola sp. Vm1 TaxID=3398393 RepID=UPI0039F5486E
MIRRHHVLLLCLALCAVGASVRADEEQPLTVVRFALDAERTRPYIILTNPVDATAVEVPYPIEDWAGRAFTTDPEKIAGDFFLRLRRGERTFFISPIVDGARRTLHIVMRGRTYPIEVAPAGALYAFRKVTFFDPAEEARQATEAAVAAQRETTKARNATVQRLASPPRRDFTPATDEMQLGLIRFMQMLSNLPEKQAESAVAANAALAWARRDTDPSVETDRFRIRPYFVVRNNAMSALGVAVSIENKTQRRLTFLPDSFILRSGDEVLPATAADFNPIVEPGEKNIAFFVIARKPDGQRVLLEPSTPMRLSIALVRDVNPNPAISVDVSDLLPSEEPKP